MRAYIAFCKKEWMESIRTYKLFIMLVIFTLIGVMNPMFALLLPTLLSGVDLGGGIIISMPEPTAMDSWAQFYSNVGQIGLLAMVIVFSGVTANEFSKETLINILTKGMKRRTIITAKFTVAALIWTFSYLLCLGITAAYTAFYWEAQPMSYSWLALGGPWLYGLILIALMIFGGIVFKNIYGSLFLVGGVFVVLVVLNIIPSLQRYNPNTLVEGAQNLLLGQLSLDHFLTAIYSGFILLLVTIFGTIVIFNKKQL